jgi:REP element-mobilizing transposase RayT
VLSVVSSAAQVDARGSALRFDARVGRPQRNASGCRIQHITARGNDRRDIFLDESDYRGFLAMLGGVAEDHAWRTLAYCLMPNHIHLVIGADVDAMSGGMRDLLGRHARRFHRRHGTSGHLFGGRFHNVPVTEDRQVAAVVRYVAHNPVRAGLCKTHGDWPWSSYGPSVGDRPAPSFLDVTWLWSLVARDPSVARDHLRALVRTAA